MKQTPLDKMFQRAAWQQELQRIEQIRKERGLSLPEEVLPGVEWQPILEDMLRRKGIFPPEALSPEGIPLALRVLDSEIPVATEVLTEPAWNWRPNHWVSGWRVLPPGDYMNVGVIPRFRPGYWEIHCHYSSHPGHLHWYEVPQSVVQAFLNAHSKGSFVHSDLLGPGWTPQNRQCLYDNGVLPGSTSL